MSPETPERSTHREQRAELAQHLGKRVDLTVVRVVGPGAYLGASANADDVVLLPGTELPKDVAVGDTLNVFIYRDSEDRLVATLREPKLSLYEVVFLEVRDVTPIGAFFDMGLAKDLLVPFAEQTREVFSGEQHPIRLFVDDSDRLAGSMRVTEVIKPPQPQTFAEGQWVAGEAWRKEPELGVFVILERRYVGLLPETEPNRLRRGEAARFRIAQVLPDGKVELSIRGLAHETQGADAEVVFEVLKAGHAQRVSDKADPEAIRRLFGLSKKAFKRAVGRLLRDGRVQWNAEHHLAIVVSASVLPARSPR